MPTRPEERLEFMSPAWIDAAGQAFEHAIEGIGGLPRDLSYALCEHFADAPPHLASSDGSVSWHAKFAQGKACVGAGVPERADFTIRTDYTAALAMARTQYSAGENSIGRANHENGLRFGRDCFSVEGAAPADPDLLRVLTAMHDELARRTVLGSDIAHLIERHGLGSAANDLDRDGFCLLEDAFSSQFAEELRAALVESKNAPATLLERGRIFEEAALHPWLLTLTEYACGRGFVLAELCGQENEPGTDTPSGTCTALWVIEDSSPEMPRGSIALWSGGPSPARADRTRGAGMTLCSKYSRASHPADTRYRDIDPAILDRNPPELTTVLGFDAVLERHGHEGSVVR